MSKYLSILLLGTCCILINSSAKSAKDIPSTKPTCAEIRRTCGDALKTACDTYTVPKAQEQCKEALAAAIKYKSPCVAGIGPEMDEGKCIWDSRKK